MLWLKLQEISVAFNLWLQGGVLALSAICPSVCWIMSGRFYGFMYFYVLLILILYAVLNVFLYIKMIRHYHLPFEYAFNLCVNDLEAIAKKMELFISLGEYSIVCCCLSNHVD